MRKLLVIGLAAIALLTAAAAPASAADPARPFRGVTSGVDSYGAPACAGANWQYHHVGTGEVAHLGRVKVEVSHCTFFDLATGRGTFGPGTLTLTAADGDTLVMSEWGTAQLVMTDSGPTSVVQLHWTVIDGTGRFAHATGSGGAAPISDLAANTTTTVYWGEIAY